MTTPHRRPALGFGLGAGAALALLLGAGLAQYLRASWPFSPRGPGSAPIAAQQSAPEDAHAAHAEAAAPGSRPAGFAPVTLDPARRTALQLTTAAVEERDFTRVVRTVGVVTLDETRSAHVHAKVRGWIDGIHVNFVGQRVQAGEPLCSIFSQEVYTAELEFLTIVGRSSTRAESDPLLDAARKRLALWDVPKREIARLEATREQRRTFPLLAPRAGTVIAKAAIQGMYVEPSLELYTLSDLSRVWVLVDIYETDVPWVRVGDRARLTLQGGASTLEAKVAFLAPTIDEATRTRKIRFELQNPDGLLLPGAFVSVELELAMGRGLAIPESAVIRTGTRAIAFVAHGPQGEHLEPRELRLGPLVGDSYFVEGGVTAGEVVATVALFLLDSESRLRATSGPGGGHVH